jgi:hypothetical protein
MLKPLIVAVPVLLWVVAVASADSATAIIDLNKPGVLEALQSSDPTHYQKVREILDGVVQQSDNGVPRWIQTNFDGRDVKYGPVLLASDPPKKHLSFTLDDTRYKALVTLTNFRVKRIPSN